MYSIFIEWLLASHENGRGPVDYHDPSQRDRIGLDLRGCDLSHTNLQHLPLARTIGDVTWNIWTTLTEKQHRMAAMQLQHADLASASDLALPPASPESTSTLHSYSGTSSVNGWSHRSR